MRRVRVLVEGQTERAFVETVLKPHFAAFGIYCHAMLFRPKGGVPQYNGAKDRIIRSLKSDAGLYCTTMVDFYGMPTDWPDRGAANGCQTVVEKAKIVEDALFSDIQIQMGDSFNSKRFIPYVQMHEFEALLFSNPHVLASKLDASLTELFQRIRSDFSSPEDINDHYETCPSRRIEKVYSGYSKVVDGPQVAGAIGLEVIRSECPHFDQWLTKLESLAS